MRRLLSATPFAAALAVALAAAATTGAATPKASVVLDPGCYLTNGGGLLTGTGFTPNGQFVTSNGALHDHVVT